MQNFMDKKISKTEEILWNNEVSANKTVIILSFVFAGFLALFIMFGVFGVFDLVYSLPFYGSCAGALVVTAIIGMKFNGKKKWVKTFLLTAFVVIFAFLNFGIGYSMPLTIVIPVVLSCRYGSAKTTRFTIILTAIFFVIADILTVVLKSSIDFNWAVFENGFIFDWTQRWTQEVFDNVVMDKTILDTFTFSLLPKYLLFAMVSIVCYLEARNSKNNLLYLADETEKNAKIEADLAIAANIQADMLPSDFSAYSDRTDFGVYALMKPAKEVGGDFYDIFMIDDKRLAVVIADVSGKGVPAALFMAIAKSLIKVHANMNLSPKDIFEKVNKLLCENNKSGFFVTAWLGILDLSSGKMSFVNAGHNPPVLLCKNGNNEFIKERGGFVLAGRKNSVYQESELLLNKGDRLFLYTDGVTEAKNLDKKMYGNDKLTEYLTKHPKENLEKVLNGVFDDVNNFAGGQEQFDDITMLMLEYKGKNNDG